MKKFLPLSIFLICVVSSVFASPFDTHIFYYNKRNKEVKRKRATHYYRVQKDDSTSVYSLKSFSMVGILQWECECLALDPDNIQWGKFNKKSKDIIKQKMPRGMVLHGRYRQYFHNGALVCEKDYDNGIELSFKKFYVNGQVMMEKKYHDGFLKYYKVFYPNLVPKLFRIYDKGKEISFYSYYENGKVRIHREFNNGVVVMYSEHDENGNLVKQLDQLPRYIHGDLNDAHRFITRSIVYPSDAQRKDITGDVIVIVDIDTNGDVFNTRIVKGVCSSIDDEASRVVKLLKFHPAKSNNKTVESELRFLIRFTLDKKV
ncbi:TonB family protein [Halosquirtibacter laminarini]|uniref:TonB family protein n=1 Tax=Halosquirtibacter laminarini TaxID=3374600 RepID=A0AC61NN94_9BACT|nr:TonB family protein [Prolixibacteraceae bacterium]